MSIRSLLTAAICFGFFSLTLHAQSEPKAQAAPLELTRGDIVKIDATSKKITIKHGPIANLGMPAMTMAFSTRAIPADKLRPLKPADPVRFRAEEGAGELYLTLIEPARP